MVVACSSEHAIDGGPADVVIPGDRAQAVAMLPVAQDGFAIEIECRTADVPAFEPGPAHAGANSLHDQIAFELGDGSDDHDDWRGPEGHPCRSARGS